MSDTLLTFQKFNDPELAATIAAQLREQGIASRIVNETIVFDATFANNNFEPTIQLKLAPSDFNRAHAALENYYQSQLNNLDPDYYLLSFSDAELLDLIQHPDEWGHFDYALAKQLLARRGQPVTSDQEAAFRQQRLTVLAQPETAHPLQVFFGYICAIAGSILGFILGYVLAYMQKTLPNGERVYVYSQAERRHGKRILVLSAIFFPFWLGALIFRDRGFPFMHPL